MDLLLLTHHGSIVSRREGSDQITHADLPEQGLNHRPLTVRGLVSGQPATAAACLTPSHADFQIDGAHTAFFQGVSVLREPGARTLQFTRDGRYLSAIHNPASLDWARTKAQTWETFFLLTLPEYERLLALTGSALQPLHGGKGIGRHDIRLAEGFIAEVGSHRLPLEDLLASLRQTYLLDLPGGGIYALQPVAPETADERLGKTPEALAPPLVGEHETFRARQDARLDVTPLRHVFVRPPITMSREDDELFVSRQFQGNLPPVGSQPVRCTLWREQNRYVVMRRFAEGVIIGEHGSSNEWGFLTQMRPLPGWLRREGTHLRIDRNGLAERAIRHEQKIVCFYNGNLQNYFHWLIEAMLPLDILLRHRLPDFALLMPRCLTTMTNFDHLGMMAALGFDDVPMHWCDDEVILVDEVTWMEDRGLALLPPELVQAFNRRIRERLGGPGRPARRLYIRRREGRGLANEPVVEELVRQWGFESVILENLPFVEQVRLFQDANFVIAPHGAGLSNLLFCAPDTRVIELMPDVEMRPFFWQIATKLDLVYGLLHCPMVDDPLEPNAFNRRLQVDTARLKTLFTMLETRR